MKIPRKMRWFCLSCVLAGLIAGCDSTEPSWSTYYNDDDHPGAILSIRLYTDSTFDLSATLRRGGSGWKGIDAGRYERRNRGRGALLISTNTTDTVEVRLSVESKRAKFVFVNPSDMDWYSNRIRAIGRSEENNPSNRLVSIGDRR